MCIHFWMRSPKLHVTFFQGKTFANVGNTGPFIIQLFNTYTKSLTSWLLLLVIEVGDKEKKIE